MHRVGVWQNITIRFDRVKNTPLPGATSRGSFQDNRVLFNFKELLLLLFTLTHSVLVPTKCFCRRMNAWTCPSAWAENLKDGKDVGVPAHKRLNGQGPPLRALSTRVSSTRQRTISCCLQMTKDIGRPSYLTRRTALLFIPSEALGMFIRLSEQNRWTDGMKYLFWGPNLSQRVQWAPTQTHSSTVEMHEGNVNWYQPKKWEPALNQLWRANRSRFRLLTLSVSHADLGAAKTYLVIADLAHFEASQCFHSGIRRQLWPLD